MWKLQCSAAQREKLDSLTHSVALFTGQEKFKVTGMVLICLGHFGETPTSCQMLCIATALRDTSDVLFFILIFYTALFPGFRHFDPSLCFDTGSPSLVHALKITLIGSAAYRVLAFSTFPWSAAKFTKRCLLDENGHNKFHILRMHMETRESLKNSTYTSLTYSCLCATF